MSKRKCLKLEKSVPMPNCSSLGHWRTMSATSSSVRRHCGRRRRCLSVGPWCLVIVSMYSSFSAIALLLSVLLGDEVLEAGERGRGMVPLEWSLPRRGCTCGPIR